MSQNDIVDQSDKKPSKSVKHLKLAVILSVVILTMGGVGHVLERIGSPERLEGEIQKGVDEINRRSPIVLDAVTKITSASAHGLDVTYNVDVALEVPANKSAEFARQARGLEYKVICEGDGTRKFVKYGTTFTYQFHLMSGATVPVRIDNCDGDSTRS